MPPTGRSLPILPCNHQRAYHTYAPISRSIVSRTAATRVTSRECCVFTRRTCVDAFKHMPEAACSHTRICTTAPLAAPRTAGMNHRITPGRRMPQALPPGPVQRKPAPPRPASRYRPALCLYRCTPPGGPISLGSGKQSPTTSTTHRLQVGCVRGLHERLQRRLAVQLQHVRIARQVRADLREEAERGEGGGQVGQGLRGGRAGRGREGIQVERR